MKTYRAIASALYGENPQLSVSVVGVRSQEDIFLEETRKMPIDPASPQSVKEVFDSLLATIKTTIGEQRKVNRRLSVPVVFGIPEKYEAVGLMENLRTQYKHVLERPLPANGTENKKKDEKPFVSEKFARFLTGKPSFIKKRESPPRRPGYISPDTLQHVIVGGSRTYPNAPQEVSFHPRRFDPWESGEFVRSRKFDELISQNKNFALENARLGMLLERAKAGDEAALEELRRHAAEHGRRMGTGYRKKTSGEEIHSRFLMLAVRQQPYIDLPYYNFIRWFDLRQIFAREFIQTAEISNPICIKAPGDPPSPAFADVAATYAYQLKVLAEEGSQNAPVLVHIKFPEASEQETGKKNITH